MVADRFRIDLGYDADISGRALLAVACARPVRLAAVDVHPGELTRAVEASSWRLRGTHERAQDDGATLTDRVQQPSVTAGPLAGLGTAHRHGGQEGRGAGEVACAAAAQREPAADAAPGGRRPRRGAGAEGIVVPAEYSLGGRLD